MSFPIRLSTMRTYSGDFTYVTEVIRSLGSLNPSGMMGMEAAPESRAKVPDAGARRSSTLWSLW